MTSTADWPARSRLTRLPSDVLVDVEADHSAAGPGQVGEQRSVIARAGSDLEHPITGLNGKLLEHHGHNRGLGRRTERSPVAVPSGHDGLVVISLRHGRARQEQLARHRPERGRHRHIADSTGRDQSVHQPITPLLRAAHARPLSPACSCRKRSSKVRMTTAMENPYAWQNSFNRS